MSKPIKIIIKIILIFLFLFLFISLLEMIFDVEIEPYYIYMSFIMMAGSMGWLNRKNR